MCVVRGAGNVGAVRWLASRTILTSLVTTPLRRPAHSLRTGATGSGLAPGRSEVTPGLVGGPWHHRAMDTMSGAGGGATRWEFTAILWRWQEGAWHFVTVPEGVSDEVDAVVGDDTGGFGSVRVEVSLGGSVWGTSLFPSAERAAYVLPVKRQVRTAEGVAEGDEVRIGIRLVGR